MILLQQRLLNFPCHRQINILRALVQVQLRLHKISVSNAKTGSFIAHIDRGIQYVYCMMHKCIMIKTEAEEKTRKVAKKQIN